MILARKLIHYNYYLTGMKHFYCAGKLETLPKTTVRLHWLLWKKAANFTSEHHFSPFYCFFSNSVNSLFFNMRVQTGSHYLVNEYEIIQQWLFQGLKWSLCLVVNSSPLAHFPKRLQTMKIYRREMVQMDRC